jgi:hypothetical protein
MNLNLVDRRDGVGFVGESIQMCGLEVRDTDAASTPVSRELFKDFPGGDKVPSVERGQRPVNQEQVDIIGIQGSQSFIERAARVIGLVKAVVELAGNENLGAVETGVADSLADSLVILIHLRSVDVPVSDV